MPSRLVMLLTVAVSLVVATGCDDSGDGDADSDVDADADGDSDGDTDGDGDADADADGDADGDGDGDGDGDADADADADADPDADVDVDADADDESDTDGDGDADGDGDCVPGCDGGPCGPGEWATICAGTFTMGSPAGELGRYTGETQHRVTLTHDFLIGSTEVTQGEFETLMGYNPSFRTICGGTCPVEQETWHEAAAYCNALSAGEGFDQCYDCIGVGTDVTCEPAAVYETPYDCPGYRLPTEAEWEYAARAGTTTGTYNGNPDVGPDTCGPSAVLDPIAWWCGNAETPHPVGELDPNEWGPYDMLGNVWERNEDWFEDYVGDANDPWGPEAGSNRVIRGGSWWHGANFARAAFRMSLAPGIRDEGVGFRPARSLEP
jgi:formylglycine-generating enzyme required for sulfatase activity